MTDEASLPSEAVTETREDVAVITRRARPSRADLTRRRTPAKRGPDLSEFKSWLASLGTATAPTVHINGPSFSNCVLTVDFGHPSKSNRINSEQVNDLVLNLRKATRDVMQRDVTVRISNDSQTGIWWTSAN